MGLQWLENLMYQLSGWFMAPVLVAISLLFLYSLYALGKFAGQWLQRRHNAQHYAGVISLQQKNAQQLAGYSLMVHALQHQHSSMDQLDVMALKKLEILRITTRIAPMLGLIATMIPMAPALKALSDGNVNGISESLIIAFSAVIFGMVIASLTFWIASVEKRWLATELVDIARLRSHNKNTQENDDVVEELSREVA